MNYHSFYVASTYDSGAYGSGTYENATTTSTASSTSTTPASSASTAVLTNTGFDILASITLASAIIFVSLMVRFWKRPSSNPQ